MNICETFDISGSFEEFVTQCTKYHHMHEGRVIRS
jgi:hypothetical protein